MKQQTFKKLLSKMEPFNSRQLRQLEEGLHEKRAGDKAASILETSFEEIFCPHCGAMEKWRWGKREQLQQYRCKACRRTYNSLSGTPLARLNKKEVWLNYAECLISGYSVRKAAKICGINKNTAFHWRYRFLKSYNTVKSEELMGIRETRETYFRKSQKGQRKLNRKPRKRGGRGGYAPKKEFVCFWRESGMQMPLIVWLIVLPQSRFLKRVRCVRKLHYFVEIKIRGIEILPERVTYVMGRLNYRA